MTDGKGRTVDFKNTILIMTSNLGSDLIMEMGSRDPKGLKTRIDELMHRQFKPEFLNRIDEIITFHGLTRDDLRQIVDIQLDQLKLRLAEQKFGIDLADSAKDFLVKVGYDPAFGARPLKRAIQHYIQDGLAMEILDGSFKEGDKIVVSAADDGHSLTFTRA